MNGLVRRIGTVLVVSVVSASTIAALACTATPAGPPQAEKVVPTAAPSGKQEATVVTRPTTLATLKYGTAPGFSSAGTYIGIERGHFQEVGLELDVARFPNGPEMIQPLATRQLDIGVLDTGAGVFNALTRDLPIRFVADASHYNKGNTGSAIVVRKDLADSGEVMDLSDLRGKKISPIARGSLLDALAHMTLAKAGLKPSDVDIQYVGFAESLAAFKNRGLDAAFLVEPFTVSAVEQGLGVVKWATADLHGTIQGPVVVYSPSITADRQEVGRRFAVAYLRGVRDFVDAFKQGKDRDAIVAILSKYAVEDRTLYQKMVLPDIDPNGEIRVF